MNVHERHNIMTADGSDDWITAIFINDHFVGGVPAHSVTPYTAPARVLEPFPQGRTNPSLALLPSAMLSHSDGSQPTSQRT